MDQVVDQRRHGLRDRWRILAALLVPACLIGLVLRVVLYASFRDDAFSARALIAVAARGLALDALVTIALLTPVAMAVALARLTWWSRRRLRVVLLTLAFTVMLFGAACEYCFFDEFNARFNHIAFDYLLFPDEVVVNIWQSYDVTLVVAIAVAVAAALAWPLSAWTRPRAVMPLSRRARCGAAAYALAVGLVAVAALALVPDASSQNRILDEIGANGLLQAWRALRTASLDYAQFYPTVPDAQAGALAAETLGFPAPIGGDGVPLKDFHARQRHDQPYDVVVIIEESLGSEFVGALGSARPVTPGFDRWCREGLLLTNLIATGNRTVRGLEGVLCSFLPLPGDAIIKRDRSDDIASIARVLAQRGYRTEFLYGGAGSFDGMQRFMSANGWDTFIDDGLVGHSPYPRDAFRTAWGVADEHVLDVLLTRQLDAQARGQRYLGTVMTVSNHKPYLVPPGHLSHAAQLPGRSVRYGAIGGGVVVLCALLVAIGWRHARVTAVALSALLLAGYGVYFSVKVQPRGKRNDAVTYADWALARYLDQAKERGLLAHTVVLVVGDHGARVYGRQDIPAASYRIPALLLSPDAEWRGVRDDRLCSQIDLAPTALSLAGIDYRAPFLGDDLLGLPTQGGRAFLTHNRDIGMLTDDTLVVLGLQKRERFYRWPDLSPIAEPGPHEHDLADRAAATFQVVDQLYQQRRYRLPHR